MCEMSFNRFSFDQSVSSFLVLLLFCLCLFRGLLFLRFLRPLFLLLLLLLLLQIPLLVVLSFASRAGSRWLV